MTDEQLALFFPSEPTDVGVRCSTHPYRVKLDSFHKFFFDCSMALFSVILYERDRNLLTS